MNDLFSLNAAATATGRDRRTLRKALIGIVPDAEQHGVPRWRLRTIIDAMRAHDRRTGQVRLTSTGNAELTHAADEIEVIASNVATFLQRLRAAPDVAARRVLVQKEGHLVGQIDTLLRGVELKLPDAAPMLRIVRDQVVQSLISEVLSLCGWQVQERASVSAH